MLLQSSNARTILTWVRLDLDKHLNQVRTQIEHAANSDHTDNGLEETARHLTQLKYTFDTMVLPGAALVVTEMITVCEKIDHDKVRKRQAAFGALMDAIVIVPSYLDRLQAGHHDLPVLLLPIINELRAAYNANIVSEAKLFAPSLDVPLPEMEHEADGHDAAFDESFQVFSQRMLRQWETALLHWLQHQDNLELLSPLHSVCETLHRRVERIDLRRVWWVASEVIGGMLDGVTDNDVDLRRLFARLHLTLKTMTAGGEEAVDEPSVNAVSQALLFHIAKAKPGSPGVDKLRDHFNLQELVPNREALIRARGAVTGRDRELYISLGAAVEDELALIKDALDLELRTGKIEPYRREQSHKALRRLRDTLNMMGLGDSAQPLEELMPAFDASTDPDSDSEDQSRESLLMGLAEKLIQVESVLEEQITMLGEPILEDQALHYIDLPRHEYRRIQAHLLEETVVSLHKVQDGVRRHFDGNQKADYTTPMKHIAGALALIGDADTASLSIKLRRALENLLRVAGAESEMDPDQLDDVADAVAALELYLAGCRDQQDNRGRFLEILKERLDRLPVDEIDAAKTAVQPPIPEEEPEQEEEPTLEEEPEQEEEPTLEEEPEQEEEPTPEEEPEQEEEPTPEKEPEREQEPTQEPATDEVSDEPVQAAIDPELLEIFLEEFESVIDMLADQIPQWVQKPGDAELITDIRRGYHTLKGSGRMVGANEIGEFAWHIEELLNALLEGGIEYTDDLALIVRISNAALPDLKERMQQQTTELNHTAIEAISQQAKEITEGKAPDWTALSKTLPASFADLLPADVVTEPETSAEPTAVTEKPTEDTLRDLVHTELAEKLAVLKELLDNVFRDRNSTAGDDEILAAHSIAGTTALEPQGRESEIAKALEGFFEIQRQSGKAFSDTAIGAVAASLAYFETCLAMLEGDPEAKLISDEDKQIEQLHALTSEYEVPEPSKEETAEEPEPAEEVADDETKAEVTEKPAEEAKAVEETGPAADEEETTAEKDETAEPDASEPVDTAILNIFLEEATVILERCDSLLNTWRDNLPELSIVQNLQREIHTFKGGARMAGIDALGDLSHSMETLLERIAGQLLPPSVSAIEALEQGCDRLNIWAEQVVEGILPQAEEALNLFEQQVEALTAVSLKPVTATEETSRIDAPSEELQEAPDTAAPESEPAEEAVKEPVGEPVSEPVVIEESSEEPGEEPSASQHIRVNAELLDTLVNSAGEISIFRSRLEQQVGHMRDNLKEFDETVLRLQEQFRKLEIETETQIRSRYQQEAEEGSEEFDPLEMDRFSAMQQLSRSLSESVSDLQNLQDLLDEAARNSEALLIQQSRVSTELQEGLMQTRMVHFGTIAPRLRRIIRIAASETGKKARLQLRMTGGGDQLDRNVLERITAPLEHLLRNSIVHGIEEPKIRRKLKKSEEGQLSITVAAEATEFVVRVEDDGAGMNLKAIKKRAVELGLLDKNAKPPRQQLLQFILHSGFSTSKTVTALAGRGVGMDVVNSEVKQIGGSIEIESEEGKSSRLTIRIPFTLAVMQAVGVMAGEHRYLIPVASVAGVARMMPADYAGLLEHKKPVYEFAGEQFSVLELEPLLGEPSTPLGDETVSILMIKAGEQRAAFRVPELLGHREIVIKPVGPQISSVPGILGGTITGDGHVVVIIDTGPLIRKALLTDARPTPPMESADLGPKKPLVLVVDDSITMRKVSTRVLESHDFEVVTAKDGVDATEIMLERVPDLMLLDIEMARMDGYQVAAYVRADTRLRHIPIIMITSRAGEKHRKRGEQAGANAYLSKPYKESELIMEVRQLLDIEAE